MGKRVERCFLGGGDGEVGKIYSEACEEGK